MVSHRGIHYIYADLLTRFFSTSMILFSCFTPPALVYDYILASVFLFFAKQCTVKLQLSSSVLHSMFTLCENISARIFLLLLFFPVTYLSLLSQYAADSKWADRKWRVNKPWLVWSSNCRESKGERAEASSATPNIVRHLARIFNFHASLLESAHRM